MAPWSGLTIKAASLALLAALGCPALGSGYIDARTGVPIKVEFDDVMFPPSWRIGDIDASAMPLKPNEHARSVRLVRDALALYPVILIQKNLRAVYVAEEFKFYGMAYGGTNSFDTVYISNKGTGNGYSDSFISRTFHHEFSSILLRNYGEKLDEEAWTEANRTRYGSGGIEALRTGATETKYNERYNVDGFLNQYGSASLEEDFNTFAEAIFSGDKQFWSVCDRFYRIKTKTTLFIAFYNKLDPQFTEKYFRDLAK